MKQARYRKLKPLNLIALALRGLSRLLSLWPWMLLAAGFFSPISPHVLWDYQHYQNNPAMVFGCRYFGLRGFARERRSGDCPFIILARTDT